MENNDLWSLGEKIMAQSTSKDLILDLKSVNVKFKVEDDTLHILRDVSLSVPRGSFLCVVGESGCGKVSNRASNSSAASRQWTDQQRKYCLLAK